jgi:hypothetical protein
MKTKIGGAKCKIFVPHWDLETLASWTLVELPGCGAHVMAWLTEDNEILSLLDVSRFVLLEVFPVPSKPVRVLHGAA